MGSRIVPFAALASLAALVAFAAGCAKEDKTLTEAPPPGPNAVGLGNAAGTKKMMGGHSGPGGGAAAPAGQPAMAPKGKSGPE